jgi:hypothetical protein
MKKLISISIISYVLLVFAFPMDLSAQDEENNRLNEFVGKYTYSVVIEQPGVKSVSFGKVEIQLIDPDTINSEFSNHDIEFVLAYSPTKKIYSFTYAFKMKEFNKPPISLFSVKDIELVYSEEEGYTFRETNEEENSYLEVTIKIGEDKVKCRIKSTVKKETFEHSLNFFV